MDIFFFSEYVRAQFWIREGKRNDMKSSMYVKLVTRHFSHFLSVPVNQKNNKNMFLAPLVDDNVCEMHLGSRYVLTHKNKINMQKCFLSFRHGQFC